MQKVELETNELGLTVFINGVPDFTLIPEETREGLLAALERELATEGERARLYKNNDKS